MYFDITFCPGSFGDKVCSRRDTCMRYWSEEVSREADKQGIKSISLFQPYRISDECRKYQEKQS